MGLLNRMYKWVAARLRDLLAMLRWFTTKPPLPPPRSRRGRKPSPSPHSDDAFLPIRGESAGATDGRVVLPHLFDDPSPIIENIQTRVAASLLATVGLDYVPGRLRSLLRLTDAFNAIALFFEQLQTSFDEVLRTPELRTFLREALSIVAEGDAMRRLVRFHDGPLYEAIAERDHARLVALAERLERLARITPHIRDIHIFFPAFEEEFRIPFERAVASWDTVDAGPLTEIETIFHDWLTLDHRFREGHARVVGILERFLEDEAILSAYRVPVDGITEALSRVYARARDGSLTAVDAIRQVEEILDDAEALADAVLAGTKRADSTPPPSSEGIIRAALELLGLPYPDGLDADRIKAAFRAKAKLHHSDVGGDDEAMRDLLHARACLLDYLAMAEA